MKSFEQLQFNNSFSQLQHNEFYSKVNTTPSTIREDLCSEAMHGLGIASSRALCMIGSDEEVYREQIDPGAMLVRMTASQTNYTIFFRALSNSDNQIRDMFIDRDAFDRWHEKYLTRRQQQTLSENEVRELMLTSNPKFILRNYLLETAIRKAQDENNYSEIEKLFKLMQTPYDEHTEFEDYAAPPPDWAPQIEASCSS